MIGRGGGDPYFRSKVPLSLYHPDSQQDLLKAAAVVSAAAQYLGEPQAAQLEGLLRSVARLTRVREEASKKQGDKRGFL